MPIQTLSTATVALMLLAPVVQAQEASSERYTLEKAEGGFVRLDRQTGAIALCKEADGSLTCRMAADERAAYDADLARLEKRVEALEAKLGSDTALKSDDLPSDAEIDRSIGIMERFMRAFVGLVQEFRAEEEQETPQRT